MDIYVNARRSFPIAGFGFLVLAGWAAGFPARGQESYRPVILARKEGGEYRARLAGKEETRWKAKWVLETADTTPPFLYHVRDEATGTFGPDNLKLSKTTEAEFILDRGEIRMVRGVCTIRDDAGTAVKILQATFDEAKNAVTVRTSYPGRKKEETEKFDPGGKVVETKEVVSFLRGFPFREGGELDFEMLTDKPTTYSITATYEGEETVTVPAGTFVCHKVRLAPDLGILTFIGKIIAPDLYFWFTAQPPHFWVKFEGPDGERGAPDIVSELVSFNVSTGPGS
jgi:hypothetical protein